MKRGEIWWAELPEPAGRRPVVLLSRDEAYAVRELVTIAPVTTRARRLPVEVPLGKPEGLPRACVANLDTITTIPKQSLVKRITLISPLKLHALNDALRFALGLDDE
jgi:mRNA interferase MazF